MNSWENRATTWRREALERYCLQAGEKFVGKRLLGLFFLPSEHKPRTGLGDYKKRLFIGSVEEEASVSEICKRSNDLSFTLEKPCFYSYLWGYGTRC